MSLRAQFRFRSRCVRALAATVVAGVTACALAGSASAQAGPVLPQLLTPLQAPGDSPFQGSGMWIWYVSRSSGGNPDAIAARAHAAGISTVFVKSSDGSTWWPQFSPALVAALEARGLHVCAWQYV